MTALLCAIALCEQCNIQNAVFFEETFGKNQALDVHLICTKMSIVFDSGWSTNYCID